MTAAPAVRNVYRKMCQNLLEPLRCERCITAKDTGHLSPLWGFVHDVPIGGLYTCRTAGATHIQKTNNIP